MDGQWSGTNTINFMSVDDLEVFMVKEAAAMFRIQPNTVYARLHEWPHHRIGTLIRFSRSDVEAILGWRADWMTPVSAAAV